MKRFRIAVMILVLTIVAGIASTYYIDRSCAHLIDRLNLVLVDVGAGEKESSAKKLQYVIDEFEKIKPFLNVLVGQGETTEIRTDLNKSVFFINTENKDAAILHLQECKMDLNRIITTNFPTISTIL